MFGMTLFVFVHFLVAESASECYRIYLIATVNNGLEIHKIRLDLLY